MTSLAPHRRGFSARPRRFQRHLRTDFPVAEHSYGLHVVGERALEQDACAVDRVTTGVFGWCADLHRREGFVRADYGPDRGLTNSMPKPSMPLTLRAAAAIPRDRAIAAKFDRNRTAINREKPNWRNRSRSAGQKGLCRRRWSLPHRGSSKTPTRRGSDRVRALADITEWFPCEYSGAPLRSGGIWPRCRNWELCQLSHCSWADWHERQQELPLSLGSFATIPVPKPLCCSLRLSETAETQLL